MKTNFNKEHLHSTMVRFIIYMFLNKRTEQLTFTFHYG